MSISGSKINISTGAVSTKSSILYVSINYGSKSYKMGTSRNAGVSNITVLCEQFLDLFLIVFYGLFISIFFFFREYFY